VARRRLRAAVTTFDHAPIHTIHGFCHRVLVEDAFAAQRMFEQTQVADEVAFDTAFVALLRERFARVSPDRELLAAFLETGKTVHRLRDVLARLRAGRSRRADPAAARARCGARGGRRAAGAVRYRSEAQHCRARAQRAALGGRTGSPTSVARSNESPPAEAIARRRRRSWSR